MAAALRRKQAALAAGRNSWKFYFAVFVFVLLFNWRIVRNMADVARELWAGEAPGQQHHRQQQHHVAQQQGTDGHPSVNRRP